MKRLLMALFVLVVAAAMCHAATISITFPNGGEKLPLKQTVTVTWSFIAQHPESPYAKLVLFKGGTDSAHKVGNIVQNLHITYGENYQWQVGAHEGGFAGVGNDYYLRIISMNGDSDYSDFSNNPFSIVLPKLPFDMLHREWVELNPDPGCPMCGVFNIEDLLARLGNRLPPIGRLVILRNGRQVGYLGTLSGGLLLNRAAKLQFGAEDFALLGQENQGFEVAILDVLRSHVLKRQAISLKMKR